MVVALGPPSLNWSVMKIDLDELEKKLLVYQNVDLADDSWDDAKAELVGCLIGDALELIRLARLGVTVEASKPNYLRVCQLANWAETHGVKALESVLPKLCDHTPRPEDPDYCWQCEPRAKIIAALSALPKNE